MGKYIWGFFIGVAATVAGGLILDYYTAEPTDAKIEYGVFYHEIQRDAKYTLTIHTTAGQFPLSIKNESHNDAPIVLLLRVPLKNCAKNDVKELTLAAKCYDHYSTIYCLGYITLEPQRLIPIGSALTTYLSAISGQQNVPISFRTTLAATKVSIWGEGTQYVQLGFLTKSATRWKEFGLAPFRGRAADYNFIVVLVIDRSKFGDRYDNFAEYLQTQFRIAAMAANFTTQQVVVGRADDLTLPQECKLCERWYHKLGAFFRNLLPP